MLTAEENVPVTPGQDHPDFDQSLPAGPGQDHSNFDQGLQVGVAEGLNAAMGVDISSTSVLPTPDQKSSSVAELNTDPQFQTSLGERLDKKGERVDASVNALKLKLQREQKMQSGEGKVKLKAA